MPIYEYQCTQCGHQLEIIQKIDEPPCSECPECKQSTLLKKVSAAGFQLKGTGWYVTDFKGSGSGGAEKSTEASTASPEKPSASEKEQGAQTGSQDT